MEILVKILLDDERFCRSKNMQEFFRKKRNKHYLHVVRFGGALYFATLGWLSDAGKEDAFAGVRVVEVACQGKKATTGYPSWQKGGDHEDVTAWFWERYFSEGMYGIYEVWHRDYPPVIKKHAECSTI